MMAFQKFWLIIAIFLQNILGLGSAQKELSTPEASLIPILSPTPTPTPRPLTFSEMNVLYGPCVYLPTLMYHHVNELDAAQRGGFAKLNVVPEVFRKQLGYLRDKGYSPVFPEVLINFFDSGTMVPKKSILLTFDDGYDDFATVAAPILKEFGFRVVMFLPTGLVGNPRYMNWSQINEIVQSGLVYIANHTWSHRSVGVANDVMEREISTADTQLAERGLNSFKVFAYPYGNSKEMAEVYLNKLGYKLAFTTRPGSIQCKKKRFELPRTRIGNSNLDAYGL